MMFKQDVDCNHPFGDGKASERIVRITTRAIEEGVKLRTID